MEQLVPMEVGKKEKWNGDGTLKYNHGCTGERGGGNIEGRGVVSPMVLLTLVKWRITIYIYAQWWKQCNSIREILKIRVQRDKWNAGEIHVWAYNKISKETSAEWP